jgi:hypothetical protein
MPQGARSKNRSFVHVGIQEQQIEDLSPTINEAHFIAKPFLPKEILQKKSAILGNTDACKIDDEMVGNKL